MSRLMEMLEPSLHDECIYTNSLIYTPEAVVGYEQNMYTLFEKAGYLEVCLVVTRSGSKTPFVINITTSNGTACK